MAIRLAFYLGKCNLKTIGMDKVKIGWDRGLEFSEIKTKLEREMKGCSRGTTYSNLAVLYIQLVNGSRVSEAVDALNEFLTTGKRDLQIRLRKRWKRTGTGEVTQVIEYRTMLVPSFIKRQGAPRTPAQVKVFAIRRGINTHSLRYAFVSHMSQRGVAPQIIAKITHHKKLERIIDYTSQKVADKLLREVAE